MPSLTSYPGEQLFSHRILTHIVTPIHQFKLRGAKSRIAAEELNYQTVVCLKNVVTELRERGWLPVLDLTAVVGSNRKVRRFRLCSSCP